MAAGKARRGGRRDPPGRGSVAGQIHRHGVTADRAIGGWTTLGSASTHGLGIGEAIHLAQVMDRMPERLVIFAVEAADIGYGEHLSQPVSASLPELTQAVLAELRSCPPNDES